LSPENRKLMPDALHQQFKLPGWPEALSHLWCDGPDSSITIRQYGRSTKFARTTQWPEFRGLPSLPSWTRSSTRLLPKHLVTACCSSRASLPAYLFFQLQRSS
jgi:hypothetical protein